MRDVTVAITEASYSGNKGAAAMLQSSIQQLHDYYGERLNVFLMSVYPRDDREQVPFDFVKVISAKPAQVLFVAYPVAVLYRLLHRIVFIKKLLLKNHILKTYYYTDVVVNEAGVSMVDSRGFIMNIYSFVCSEIPMLMGIPVIKYSQALGSFDKLYNRVISKWQLPKFNKIIARGESSRTNLQGIGVIDNVVVCADGAFSMEDNMQMKMRINELWANDPFYKKEVVGVSISGVVQRKCKALGIDYSAIIVDFIKELNNQGFNVLIIANAARINSTKTRTNDLMLGDEIYAACNNSPNVKWYHEEMTAEQLREHIGHCRFLVASRFHSMIAGLERGIPVLLIGWSHKYQEVLDMFELGEYATDFSNMSKDKLVEGFARLKDDEKRIRASIDEHIEQVRLSSKKNVSIICSELDNIISKNVSYNRIGAPQDYLKIRKGYALRNEYRTNCASGGLITALLCNMLRHGDIDGAWVTKTQFEAGKVTYRTYIAISEDEICDSGSSVYLTVPMLGHLDMIRDFPGKVAVVMQPCILNAFNTILERSPELKKKIVLRIGLFCSGTCKNIATAAALKKAGIRTENAHRLCYRTGFWRGRGFVEYIDGHREDFSYTKYFCSYKNAYFFSHKSCFHCSDHFANCADVSFGDVWLKEMKNEKYKHTGAIIRSKRADDYISRAVDEGDIVLRYMGERDLLRSQRRALVFKFRVCDEGKRKRWNEKLVYCLACFNRDISSEHPQMVIRVPQPVVFMYMCFIRWLLDISR